MRRDWKAAGGLPTLSTAPTQVCDALEDSLGAGGCIVDYHGCDFFPERCASARRGVGRAGRGDAACIER